MPVAVALMASVPTAVLVAIAPFPRPILTLLTIISELKVCTPVKVCAASVRAIVASVAGKVMVFPSVPAKTTELVAVRVLPSAIVKVEPVLGAVMVTLLIVVAEAIPKVGENKVGEVLKTNEPVPVLLVMALNKFILEGVAKKVATFAPRSVMSAVPTVPQAGATAAEPVPVCVKNFLVADVFPDKNELVFAAD